MRRQFSNQEQQTAADHVTAKVVSPNMWLRFEGVANLAQPKELRDAQLCYPPPFFFFFPSVNTVRSWK